MRVCILGGGVCGLVAALHLSKSSEVTILERERESGGCLSSYRLDGSWVERFYHHCFAGDSRLLSLLDEVGLSDRLEWLKGTTGSFAGGKIYPLNTPLEILRYPYLTIPDKARLALFTMRARKKKWKTLIRSRQGLSSSTVSGRGSTTSSSAPDQEQVRRQGERGLGGLAHLPGRDPVEPGALRGTPRVSQGRLPPPHRTHRGDRGNAGMHYRGRDPCDPDGTEGRGLARNGTRYDRCSPPSLPRK